MNRRHAASTATGGRSIRAIAGGGRKDSFLRGRPSGGKTHAGSSKWSSRWLITAPISNLAGREAAADRCAAKTGPWTTSGRAHVSARDSLGAGFMNGAVYYCTCGCGNAEVYGGGKIGTVIYGVWI